MGADLVSQALQGDRRAIARLITAVENQSPDLLVMMARVHEGIAARGNNHAIVVGITGPPGAGKSTLIDQFIRRLRTQKKKVSVVAIDPSSPFSGGALLGDRIRMQDHFLDEDVFIRSLGTRGSHGGVSRATRDVVKIFAASGSEWIIVETVGVGQTELDIMEIADTTVVVLTPESGDTIQTMKAGLLEIANIFAVNKSDRDGAIAVRQALESMIELGGTKPWHVPVMLLQADKGTGVDELLETILQHRATQSDGARADKVAKVRQQEVEAIVFDEVRKRVGTLLKGKLNRAETNPYRLAGEISKRIKI